MGKYIMDSSLSLKCGDMLDAPEWNARRKEGETKGTQHDIGHFDIALELAWYVAEVQKEDKVNVKQR